jgi:hypothetical protein
MQQQELQLKSQELELKKQKMAIDAAAKADDLDIRETQVSGQLQLEAMKLAAQTSSAEQQRAAQELAEGVKLGIQVGRDRADLALREKQLNKPSGGAQ